MKIVCAWCKKEMGEKEPVEDKTLTHGICKECYIKCFQPDKNVEPGYRHYLNILGAK